MKSSIDEVCLEELSVLASKLSDFITYPPVGESVKKDYKDQAEAYMKEYISSGHFDKIFKLLPSTFDTVDDYSVDFFAVLCQLQEYMVKYTNRRLILTVFDFRDGSVSDIIPMSIHDVSVDKISKMVPCVNALSLDNNDYIWTDVPFSCLMVCGYAVRKARDLRKIVRMHEKSRCLGASPGNNVIDMSVTQGFSLPSVAAILF